MNRWLVLALGISLIFPQLALAGAKTYTDKTKDHQWNTADNWNPKGVPVSTDDVTIPGNKSATVVNYPDAANTVTVAAAASLIINGSLQITSTSTFSGTLTLTGGPLTLGGDSTITGPLQLSGGWTSSIGSPTVTISGPTTVTSSSSLGGGSNYFNKGTITIMGDGTLLSLGGVFNNQSKIDIQGDGTVQSNAGISSPGGTINNSGTIAKTMGNGISILSSTGQINNSGTVSAATGTLQVIGGNGTETGTFTAARRATLEFPPGEQSNFTLNSGTIFNGGGRIEMTGGIWTLAADVTVKTTTMQLDAGGSNVINGTNNLTIKSTTVTWNSGGMGAKDSTSKVTLEPGSVMNLATTGYHDLYRNLDLFGTLNMSADVDLGAVIGIEQGAVFNIQTDNGIHGSGTIVDGGTFEKTGSTGASHLEFTGNFDTNSNGTVTVTSGTLDFAVQGTSGPEGNWTVTGANTILIFSAGTYNLGTSGGRGLTITGSGTTVLADAIWDVQADSSVDTPQFDFQAGSIGGDAKLTITSKAFAWSGGSMAGTGVTKIAPGVTATLSGSPTVSLRTIYNYGDVNLSTSTTTLTLAGATLNNEAKSTLTFQDDGNITDGGGGASTFNNSGTVQKMGGTGTSTVSFNGTFNNDGKVIVQGGVNLSLATPMGTSTGEFIAKGTSTMSFDKFSETGTGNWTISGGTTMTGNGTISLNATWDLGADLVVQSALFDDDGLVIGNGWKLSIASRDVFALLARFQGGGKKLQLPASGCSLTIPKATTHAQVDGLSLSSCAFDNSASIKITGASGTLSLNSSTLLNETSGKITLDTPTGSNAAAIAGDSSSTVTNSGVMTLGTDSGANTTQTISTQGSFSNSGSISVPAKRTLDVSSLTQTGGATSVAKGGTLAASGTLTISGGTIGGSGTISGPTNNTGGTIEAGSGNVTGKLALSAPETQGAGATMTALISGTTAGTQYDQINSTSSMTLGGTLNLQFGNGFMPAPTDKFNILNFSSVTGSFSTVNAPTGWTAHLKFTATSLKVQFTKNGAGDSIEPKAATVKVNETAQFTVGGASASGVTWSVKESGGGTVTQTGLYTAPRTPGTYHVAVTSGADRTQSDTATVTVIAAGTDKLTVTPQAAVVHPGGRLHLRANTAVTWTVAEGVSGGSVTRNGTYTAAAEPGLYHVMATSTTDAANHAIVNVAVVNGKLKSAYITNLDKNSVSVLAAVTGSGPEPLGQLRQVESVSAGQAPVALAISPPGTLLLAANQDSNNVARFRVSSADGTLRLVSGPASETGTRPSAVALDRSGKLVFVANRDSDDLSVFSVDRASGQMVLLGKQALGAGDKPSAIAVHPGGPWIFVTSAEANTVRGFTYDAAGMLRSLNQAPLATGIGPSAALIDAAGRFLFTANRGSGDVSVFAIDAQDGTLREVKGSPFAAGRGAKAIAIDVTGSYLFVADHGSNDVASLQIDGETGGLTLLSHTPLAAAGPSAMAVDPSGQYVYVTSDKAGGLTSLKLNVSTGRLTPSASTQNLGRTSAIVVTGSRAVAQAP